MPNAVRAAELTRLHMLLRRAALICQHRGDERDAETIITEIMVKLAVPSLTEVLARLDLLIEQTAQPRTKRARRVTPATQGIATTKRCTPCGGSGKAPGAQRLPCRACGGAGRIPRLAQQPQ